MATIIRDPSAVRTSGARDPQAPAARPGSWVLMLAPVGAALIATAIVCWTQWVFSSDFKPVAEGPDRLASWRFVGLRMFEFASLAVVIWLYWYAVVRPIRQKRPIGFDGKLVIGCTLCYVIDPTLNLMNATFAFNAHALNAGSWGNFLPFMQSPGQGLEADGPLWAGAYYVYLGLGIAIAGKWLLNRVDRWRPAMPNAGRYAIVFVAVMIFDFVIENAMVRTQMYAFSGVTSWGSLWAGSLYQFPLYECVLVGFICTPLVYLRESRDDRGRSIAERGVDQLRIGPRAKEFVSFLAITGYAALCFGAYFVPYAWLGNFANVYPQLPSYMRADAYCGTPGSGRPCAGQLIDPTHTITITRYARERTLRFVNDGARP